jgi:hypothetical protein
MTRNAAATRTDSLQSDIENVEGKRTGNHQAVQLTARISERIQRQRHGTLSYAANAPVADSNSTYEQQSQIVSAPLAFLRLKIT